LGLADADYVVAVGIGSRVVLFRVPDGVAEDLSYSFGTLVFEACEAAEARAATVDAEGEAGGDEGDNSENGGDSSRDVHLGELLAN